MLYRSGKMNHNEILQVLPNYTPIFTRLFNELERDGLVVLDKETTGYKPNTIELTTLGRISLQAWTKSTADQRVKPADRPR